LEAFLSSEQTHGSLAGVFEADGETGYFYLYDLGKEGRGRVLDSLHVFSGEPGGLSEDKFAVAWSNDEKKVGLFIEGRLWAVFDLPARRKYGGDYRANAEPMVPPDLAREFG
jgi:hypothetical protein